MKIHCLYDNLVPVGELKPHPKNRNKHPDDQIERLAKILDYQGVRAPIVVSNLSGFIVKGHGTLKAIEKNGWAEAPVVRQDFDSEEKEYAFVQSDNAVAAWAELDLAGINLDLADLGPDFDIDLLGLKDFVLEPTDKLEPQCDEDEIPEKVEPRTKRGDIYLLGNHRLMCGDSTMIDDVEKLMAGEKADMVFTDPPYNIAEKTKGIASSAPTNKQNKKLMDSEWDKGFDFKEVQASLFYLSAENCTFYVCCSSFTAPDIWRWLSEVCDFSSYCVWSKPNPFPSLSKRHWIHSDELISYGTRGKHIFNYPAQGNATSVWTFPIGEGGLHPTQKPVKVPEHAIVHSSKEGALVADLFGGSGTTLIACENKNRRCFMMEREPSYCDVIVARWEKYTGRQAVLQ